MRAIGILALNEFLDGLRDRWVAAAIILLGSTAHGVLNNTPCDVLIAR